MPQITLNIPENKLQFFLEMMGSINFVKEYNQELFVPEFHKQIVRKRIKEHEANPSLLLDWETAQHKIRTE
jgi:hypothetical protein